MRFYEDSRTFSLTLPNGNEESVLAKNPEDFLLPLSTADEKCVWEKIGTLFLKAFLTLHYRGFESRLGEKTENFLKIFLFTLTTGDQLPVWPKTLEIFFSLLLLGDGRSVLKKKSYFL